MRPCSTFISRLFLATTSIFVCGRSHAADGSWNVNSSTTWATAGSWTGSVVPGSTTIDNGDIATFSFTLVTSGKTVTVDTHRYIGGLTFGNTSAFGYTLSGGTLHLNNAGVIQSTGTTGAHTDTISSNILLSGTSASFTGGATLATRLLSIGAVTGTSASATTLTLNGVNTGNNTVGGIIGNGSGGGTLGITKAAAGKWVLSGANTYTGVTTINAGTLSVASIGDGGVASGNLGSATNAAANLVLGGGTLQYTGTTASTDRNFTLTTGTTSSIDISTGATNLTISGASTATTGAMTKLGTGTLTLSGANLYTGLTSINGGTLALSGGNNRLASTSSVSFGGSATFDIGSTTQTLASLSSGIGSFTEVINGSGGSINVTGNGPFYIANGTNGTNQTSTLTIAGATVNFAATSNFHVANQTGSSNGTSVGTLTLNSGGRLNAGNLIVAYMDYTNGANSASAGGTININNGGTLSAKTIQMQEADHQNGLHSALITVNSGGTLLLGTLTPGDAVSTTYTNNIAFNGGTIKNYDASTNLVISALIGTSHTFTLGSGTPTFDISAGRTGTISEAMSSTGSLTKIGAGLLTLSAANTYTGGTNVNVGTLTVGTGGTLGASTGTLEVNNENTGAGTNVVLNLATAVNTTVGSLNGTISAPSSGTNTATISTQTGRNFTVDQTTAGTFEGVIAGAGSFTLGALSTDTLVLTGANTYTGATTITAGTLQVDGSTASGSTVGIGTAGTLSGTGTINGNATLTGAGVINKSSGTIAGALAVTGGNWNGAGGVTGAVTSSTGTFTIGSGANLTANGGLNVTGGNIAAGSSSSTITGSVNYTSSTSSTFDGVIAGSGKTLTMNNSAATLTITGINTYSGATTVTAGELVVNGSAANSAFTVNGGTLGGSGSIGALNVTGGIVGPGNSPGILTTNGNFTLGSGGTLAVEIAGVSVGSDYDQLRVNGSVNLTGTLSLDTTGYAAVNGDMLFILSNDDADAIVGTFDGLAEGSLLLESGQYFQITYFADFNSVTPLSSTFTGGNDVALMAVPEPGTSLIGGIGMLLLFRRRRS